MAYRTETQKPKGKLITSVFELPTLKITYFEGWLDLNPGYLPGRAGCGNSARPVL